ncbi:MAG: carboxypeptidase-like regulatory domain-containing protein, partial [Bacteroidales bacterium]|nr:carboxypeptidase-like regulatory domain-containing protein [Bacteroidales bacterium]
MQKHWFIGFLFLFIGTCASGQNLILDQPESLSFSNISVDSALRIIEIQSGLHFTFRSDLLQNNERINAQFKNVPLCIILDSLFENPNLNYKIIENQLVVYEQKPDSISEPMESDSIAQTGHFTFSGEVQDADTRERLSFAAISLQNSTIGTISNEDGFFSLKLDKRKSNDTVLISYLGYETFKIPLNRISEFTVYPLKSVSIPLQEVIVRGLFAENIVRLAIASKKKNYPNHSFVQRAFYRESVKHDRKYMLYSEGILDVLK